MSVRYTANNKDSSPVPFCVCCIGFPRIPNMRAYRRYPSAKYASVSAKKKLNMRAYMRILCAHICAKYARIYAQRCAYLRIYAHTYAYMRILTHICTHICATLRILTHICAYLRIYAHTYAYMRNPKFQSMRIYAHI